MSYYLQKQCQTCALEKKCADRSILQGAIHAIHDLGRDKGHLGSGTIILDCQNYQQELPE